MSLGVSRRLRARNLPGPSSDRFIRTALGAASSDPFAEARSAVGLGDHIAVGEDLKYMPWQASAPAFEILGTPGFLVGVGRARSSGIQ